MHRCQVIGDLQQRHVHLICDQGEDLQGVRLDAPRPLVATLGTRSRRARIAPAPHPLHRRRGRHSKPRRCSPTAHPASHRGHKSRAKVVGKRFRHAGWPPPPARIMNHCSRKLGIPNDSVRWENALVVSSQRQVGNAKICDDGPGVDRFQEEILDRRPCLPIDLGLTNSRTVLGSRVEASCCRHVEVARAAGSPGAVPTPAVWSKAEIPR
jgi:hypothetical protein